MARVRDGEAGFSLLEVVVAVAILGAVLAATLTTLGGSTRALGRADGVARAALVADARLAELGSVHPVEAGERSGETADGIRWEMTIEPYRPSDLDPGEILDLPVALFRATVIASGPHGGAELTTIRPGPKR